MQVLILATGKCRVAAMKALEEMYLKRLPSPQWKITVKELPDGPTPEAEAPAQLAAWAALPTPSVHIVLDEKGDMPTSRQFADKLAHWQNDSIKSLSILIGGANGTAPEVQKAATWIWSLGPLTYPHKLVRVLLAEQLYRAHTLLTGHPYHRD